MSTRQVALHATIRISVGDNDMDVACMGKIMQRLVAGTSLLGSQDRDTDTSCLRLT